MSKMSLHDSFEYLKHKLWPKEKSRVKVLSWFVPTKSWESLWNTCVQVTCHISLENSRQGLWIFLMLHFNQRSAWEVMALQNVKSSNFEIFKILNLGVLGQNDIWIQTPWLITKNTIRGKVVTSPKFGMRWVSWVCVHPWFVCAPITHWSIYCLVCVGSCEYLMHFSFILVLILEFQHTLVPLKCCKLRNIPQKQFLSLFSFSNLHLKLWNNVQMCHQQHGVHSYECSSMTCN